MKSFIIFLFVVLATTSCASKKIHFTLVQANDVYEIAPINGGEDGGLARVQTIVNQLENENKHTYTVLAGDFLSPSAIATAKIDGKRINGKQMVDTLNAMDWDYVTLGNHEFDHGKEVLIERLLESKYKTVISNVKDSATNQLFENTVTTEIIDIKGIKVGIAGLTLPVPSKTFIDISDPIETAPIIINELRQQGADVLIFITHQTIEKDIELAKKYPAIDLIMGGHEHENIYLRRGDSFTTVSKADANARSLYIHKLSFDTSDKSLTIDSKLKSVDNNIEQDLAIKAVVDNWLDSSLSAFKANGFKPENIIASSTKVLDGLEASVRNQPTLLSQIIADSALKAYYKAELSLINTGSIRIDDTIDPGPISEYDVIRILPFGGNYELFSIPGDILEQALEVGISNKGTGAYLIHANTQKIDGQWFISGKRLDRNRSYLTASSTYLMTVGDKNLKFLTKNSRIKKVSDAPKDVQKALISELKLRFPL